MLAASSRATAISVEHVLPGRGGIGSNAFLESLQANGLEFITIVLEQLVEGVAFGLLRATRGEDAPRFARFHVFGWWPDAGHNPALDGHAVGREGGADAVARRNVIAKLEVEQLFGHLAAHELARRLQAGRQADLVEVGGGYREDELLRLGNREGHQRVDVDAHVVFRRLAQRRC